MGNYTESRGVCIFQNDSEASAGMDSFIKWIDKNNKEEENRFDVFNIVVEEEMLQYTVSSQQYEYCVEQCRQILEFLKTLPGVVRVSQPIMTNEDNIDWDKDNQ